MGPVLAMSAVKNIMACPFNRITQVVDLPSSYLPSPTFAACCLWSASAARVAYARRSSMPRNPAGRRAPIKQSVPTVAPSTASGAPA